MRRRGANWTCESDGSGGVRCWLLGLSRLVTCVGLFDDWGGGRGGGGGVGGFVDGGDDDDDDADCSCNNEDQCDLAQEYDDPNDWPCTKFHIGMRFVITGPNEKGTENGMHNGYGYEHPGLVTGFGNMEAAFRKYSPFTITSGYRCPIGNRLTCGSSASSHVDGRGVDFTGYVKDRSRLWPNGTNVAEKLEIRDWAQSQGANGYYFVLVRKYFKSSINNRLYLAIGGESEGRIADSGV